MRSAWMLALGLAVVACGEDDKKDEDKPTTGSSALVGNWNIPCGTDDTGDEKTYNAVSKTFTATTFSGQIGMFSDDACATRTQVIRVTATYTVGAAVSTPAGATEIDITPGRLFITMDNADLVAFANADATKICGGGFEAGKEKELTKATCAGGGFESLFNVSYGVFKIDGDKLYEGVMGDDGSATDGSAPTKRPTTLETRPAMKS
jgi:hypothetical protein